MHTISAEELLKAYNGKYKYVTQTRYGQVQLWVRKPIMTDQNYRWAKIKNSDDEISIGQIAITEFQDKDWKECIYKATPPEEDMIGCVGWFWDNEEQACVIGILHKIEPDVAFRRYVDGDYSPWKHFRPATRDEIKFFNDDTAEV